MRRLLLAATVCVVAVAASAPAQSCREDSYCDVDLTFTTSAGLPSLCPTFDYAVHDKNSAMLLLPKVTEAAPGSKPCPRKCASGTKLGSYCALDADCPPGTPSGVCALQAGCTTVRLPASANPYVGKCVAPPPKRDTPCTANAQCTPGTCVREGKEITQPHLLTGVCEPGTAQQFTFWVELPVLNGQFVPLP